MTRKRALPAVEKRRHATVADVLNAVTADAIVGLLVKRAVTATVADEALTKLKALMGDRAPYDPRIVPLVEHLNAERAAGAGTKKMKATRRVGDIVPQKSRARPGGVSRFLVVSLATIGDPEEASVGFGANRIVIGRQGEVTAGELKQIDAWVVSARSPEEILAELERRTGMSVLPTKASGT